MTTARADAESWTPLPAATIDVWHIELNPGDDDLDLLSEDERIRAERLVVPIKRDQLIAGRAALRRVLARYLEVEATALRFSYGEHGKPALVDGGELAFNLSHSHGRALVAVAGGGRLGIDVEAVRDARNVERIATRFFAMPECRALLAQPEAERVAAFYRTWARKEAYLKALGTGLSFSSSRFVVDDTPRLVATERRDDDPARWSLRDVEVEAAYAAALCWDDEPSGVRHFDAA